MEKQIAYKSTPFAYHNDIPTSSSQPTTAKIPPSINLYNVLHKFYLGRHKDEKLFASSFGWGTVGRTVMTLYDGPTKNDRVMVAATNQKSGYLVTVPSGGVTPLSVKHSKVAGDGKEIVLSRRGFSSHEFTMDVGGGETSSNVMEFQTQTFLWRRIGGLLSDVPGCNSGWELVRAPGPMYESPKVKSRDSSALMSDGLEVVASLGQNGAWKKQCSFEFMGRGLSGSMGEDWELVALLSGLLLWYKDYNNTVATVTA